MSDSDALKKLLMLPAIAHIWLREARNRREHNRLNVGGDPKKRSTCCGRRPDSFPEGKKVTDIPELADLLKPTGYLSNEYYPAYRCRVCAQEWFQDFEPLKFGGLIHVRKAS